MERANVIACRIKNQTKRKSLGFLILVWALTGVGLSTLLAGAQMTHQVVIGTPGDDTQITWGNPGRDFILQDGLGGTDTMHIVGDDSTDPARKEWIKLLTALLK